MSAAPITAAGFEGFTPDTMRFFEELADNQNKEWMAANKGRYEGSVRDPLAALVVALSERFEAEGIALRGDPKRSLFRINRDVRFSADKRPYNDHASAALTRDGDKQSPGVSICRSRPPDPSPRPASSARNPTCSIACGKASSPTQRVGKRWLRV